MQRRPCWAAVCWRVYVGLFPVWAEFVQPGSNNLYRSVTPDNAKSFRAKQEMKDFSLFKMSETFIHFSIFSLFRPRNGTSREKRASSRAKSNTGIFRVLGVHSFSHMNVQVVAPFLGRCAVFCQLRKWMVIPYKFCEMYSRFCIKVSQDIFKLIRVVCMFILFISPHVNSLHWTKDAKLEKLHFVAKKHEAAACWKETGFFLLWCLSCCIKDMH